MSAAPRIAVAHERRHALVGELAELGVIDPIRKRQVRGVYETFYFFASTEEAQ